MKNKALYDKTVNILVQAYFNDTLQNQDCAACAVGNIICANMGYKMADIANSLHWINKDGDLVSQQWSKVFRSTTHKTLFRTTTQQEFYPSFLAGKAKSQIMSTGYNVEELAKIEFAFEKGYRGKKDSAMFSALMSVIEVLDQIHENTDQEVTASSKQMFVRA